MTLKRRLIEDIDMYLGFHKFEKEIERLTTVDAQISEMKGNLRLPQVVDPTLHNPPS
jgi:hypothetical protein